MFKLDLNYKSNTSSRIGVFFYDFFIPSNIEKSFQLYYKKKKKVKTFSNRKFIYVYFRINNNNNNSNNSNSRIVRIYL